MRRLQAGVQIGWKNIWHKNSGTAICDFGQNKMCIDPEFDLKNLKFERKFEFEIRFFQILTRKFFFDQNFDFVPQGNACWFDENLANKNLKCWIPNPLSKIQQMFCDSIPFSLQLHQNNF